MPDRTQLSIFVTAAASVAVALAVAIPWEAVAVIGDRGSTAAEPRPIAIELPLARVVAARSRRGSRLRRGTATTGPSS